MSDAVAFEHATVHTMAIDAPCVDHTLVVRTGRIAALGPSAAVLPPPDATRIDATGWHLLPGLADMHVHLSPLGVGEGPGFAPDEATALQRSAQLLKVYLLHGVTTVRNMAGTPWHLRLRQAVRDGRIAGPRIYTTGPILETRFTFAGLADFGQLVRTPEEARAAVTAQHRAGYDAIKVYNDILVEDTTIRMIQNCVPIQLGWGSYGDGATGTFRNLTIIGDHGRSRTPPVIEGTAGTYRKTIVIEGLKLENPKAALVRLRDQTMELDLTISDGDIAVKQFSEGSRGTIRSSINGSPRQTNLYRPK